MYLLKLNFVTSESDDVSKKIVKDAEIAVFFVSICCITADLRKTNHSTFCHYTSPANALIITLHWRCLQRNIPITSLFQSLLKIAGLRTPITSPNCQVGRSLPPSRALHRSLPSLQQVSSFLLSPCFESIIFDIATLMTNDYVCYCHNDDD